MVSGGGDDRPPGVVECPPLTVARPTIGDATRKLPRVLWLFFRIVGGSSIL